MTEPRDEPADDTEIVRRIDALVAETREIEASSPGGVTDDGATRLREIEVERDLLWDLKRARQARRDAGGDPDEAHERPANVVENYRQ